jgi:hypothetical protein
MHLFEGRVTGVGPFAIAEKEVRRLYLHVYGAFVLPARGAEKSLGLAGWVLPCSSFPNRVIE